MLERIGTLIPQSRALHGRNCLEPETLKGSQVGLPRFLDFSSQGFSVPLGLTNRRPRVLYDRTPATPYFLLLPVASACIRFAPAAHAAGAAAIAEHDAVLLAIRGVHDHIPVAGTVAAAIAVAAGMPLAVLEIQCITCVRIVALTAFDLDAASAQRQTDHHRQGGSRDTFEPTCLSHPMRSR